MHQSQKLQVIQPRLHFQLNNDKERVQQIRLHLSSLDHVQQQLQFIARQKAKVAIRSPGRDSFDKNLKSLKEYKEEHGHCDIPQSIYPLVTWVIFGRLNAGCELYVWVWLSSVKDIKQDNMLSVTERIVY